MVQPEINDDGTRPCGVIHPKVFFVLCISSLFMTRRSFLVNLLWKFHGMHLQPVNGLIIVPISTGSSSRSNCNNS